MVKVYGLDRFQRAFRQRSGDGHFLNLQLDGVRYLDYYEVIENLRHLAGDTTAGAPGCVVGAADGPAL